MNLRFRPSQNSSDAACLLRRAVAHPPVFSDFYDAYGERLLRFFIRKTFDVEVAYELKSETFALAFERMSQFRGSSSEEEVAWLWMIARSELREFWRKGKVERGALERLAMEPQVLDDDDIQRLVELAELDTLRPVILAAMNTLSDEHREAVELRVVHELSYDEIAERLDISNTLARAWVSRGLRALNQLLSHDDEITQEAA